MKLYLKTAHTLPEGEGLERVLTFSDGRSLYGNLQDADFRLALDSKRTVYLFGPVFYHIRDNGDIQMLNKEAQKYLERIFAQETLPDVISRLEGQYVGVLVDAADGFIQLFSDRYARLDTFYFHENAHFCFATDLDFIFAETAPRLDQKMLLHFFSVYGWYTPKGLTLYQNVKQLRIGEILTLTASGLSVVVIPFQPLKIKEGRPEDLEVYYRLLRESVAARVQAGSAKQVWVSSSSGWDSSILLGLLVDLLGPKNVRMLTGRMVYSEGTELINRFEIDRVKKIGAFYGIQPEIVEFDFKSKQAPAYWAEVMPFFKARQIYSYPNYNFAKISEGLSRLGGSHQVIFNGEASDSFHNFGFSQYSTFFHMDKSFAEYADKMNGYLFGPTFLQKVFTGEYERDSVYQIFRKMYEAVPFTNTFQDRAARVEGFLFPFLYGSPRVPFAQTCHNPLFTNKGRQVLYAFPFREYLPQVLSSLNEDNVYSWLIYLYHHFHAQGSTVNLHKQAMELNGHAWRMPFNDYRLVDLLAQAPEKWGRGLEWESTKFPLKWVAKNKMHFPYDLLQEGPHSYLCDVIEGFSLGGEITYRSGMTPYFKEVLHSRSYQNILSEDYFDKTYCDRLVDDFLNGKEARGQDLNNLISLITLTAIGWFH